MVRPTYDYPASDLRHNLKMVPDLILPISAETAAEIQAYL